MKKEPSKDYLNQILRYEDGCLYWKERKRGRRMDKRAGTISGLEDFLTWVVNIDGVRYCQHRIIWVMFNGEIPDNIQIDHIDRNKLNNDIINLRLATPEQNQYNQGIQKNNTTGVKGVSYNKKRKKFRAQIMVNKMPLHLGDFANIEDAKKAYQEAAKFYHNNFACL